MPPPQKPVKSADLAVRLTKGGSRSGAPAAFTTDEAESAPSLPPNGAAPLPGKRRLELPASATAAAAVAAAHTSLAAAAAAVDASSVPQAAIERVKYSLTQRLARNAESRWTDAPSHVMLPLEGLAAQQQEVEGFLRGITFSEESNSLLLVGPHGSGKRATLMRALMTLQADALAGEEASDGGEFKLVVLHGGTLSDDVVALREISRQLAIDTSKLALDLAVGEEEEEEEEGGEDGAEGEDDAEQGARGADAGELLLQEEEEEEEEEPQQQHLYDGGSDEEEGDAAVSARVSARGGTAAPGSARAGSPTVASSTTGSGSMGSAGLLPSPFSPSGGRHDMRGVRRAAARHWPELTAYARAACRGDLEQSSRIVRAGASVALAMLPGAAAAASAAARSGASAVVAPGAVHPASPYLPQGSRAAGAAVELRGEELADEEAAAPAPRFAATPIKQSGQKRGRGVLLRAASASEEEREGGEHGEREEGDEDEDAEEGLPVVVALRSAAPAPAAKRGRGRPRIYPIASSSPAPAAANLGGIKRGRGRPRGALNAATVAAGGSSAAAHGPGTLSHSKVRAGGNRRAYESHLAFVVAALREGRIASVPVVIVIEDFDIFARRSKQTLLYNLLDLTADRRAHLAVIGLTSRLDVIDLLEKRLKSRFSHRQVLFAPPRSRLALDRIVRRALGSPTGEGGAGTAPSHASLSSSSSSAAAPSSSPTLQVMGPTYAAAWEATLDAMLLTGAGGAAAATSNRLPAALDEFFRQGAPVRAVYRWLQLVVSRELGPGRPLLQFEVPAAPQGAASPPSSSAAAAAGAAPSSTSAGDAPQAGPAALRAASLSSLSLVEACLVIAAAHQEVRSADSSGGWAGARGKGKAHVLVSNAGGAGSSAVAAANAAAAAAQAPVYNCSLLYHEIASKLRDTNASAAALGSAAAASGASREHASFVSELALRGAKQQAQKPAGDEFEFGAADDSPSAATASPTGSGPTQSPAAKYWSVDASVALRAFERLLQSDVFRLVPRTVGAGMGGGVGALSGAGATAHWSGATLGRDRADLMYQPCLLLLEPEEVLAAVRSGGVALPSEVRQWALRARDPVAY